MNPDQLRKRPPWTRPPVGCCRSKVRNGAAGHAEDVHPADGQGREASGRRAWMEEKGTASRRMSEPQGKSNCPDAITWNKVVIFTTPMQATDLPCTISAAEANRQFSSLLRQVSQGETITVLSHGRPVATISPATEAGESGHDRANARARLLARLNPGTCRRRTQAGTATNSTTATNEDRAGHQHPRLRRGRRRRRALCSGSCADRGSRGERGADPGAQALGERTGSSPAKLRRDAETVRGALLDWSDAYEVADSTWPSFQAAIDLACDHRMQIWDGLVLSVAAENRCRLLLSEDLQHSFTRRGVTVINPFEHVAHRYCSQHAIRRSRHRHSRPLRRAWRAESVAPTCGRRSPAARQLGAQRLRPPPTRHPLPPALLPADRNPSPRTTALALDRYARRAYLAYAMSVVKSRCCRRSRTA